MDAQVTQQPEAAEGRAINALRARLAVLDAALSPDHPLRIVDIGANPINVPSYDDMLTLGSCEVWGFEPGEEAFAALTQAPRALTHYLKAAVGKPGTGLYYPHPQNGLASNFPVSKPSVAFFGKPGWYRDETQPLEMELVSLDSLSEEALPKPDVVKIDIQGGELDVFTNGRAKMDQAIAVIPEVRFFRIYEGEPMWAAVDQELQNQGFTLHKFEFTKTMSVANSQGARLNRKGTRSQLLDGDAIYIRNPETLSYWSDAQVKALAYAASGVVFSHDLAIHALDELVRRKTIAPETPARYVDSLPRWMRRTD